MERERLTFRNEHGGITVKNITEAVERLADFEDLETTGTALPVSVTSDPYWKYVNFECPRCFLLLQQSPKAKKRPDIFRYRHCHGCGQMLDWSNADADFNARKLERWR